MVYIYPGPWLGYRPPNVFAAADGMIRISGEEWGCITTVDEYENYHIVLEFKWGEATHPLRKNRARDSELLPL